MVGDLVMSLVSSVVAGSAVWLGQRLLHYRRLVRKRAFFGVSPTAGCVLVPPRHFSSPHPASVHRNDVAALVELATIVNGCGGRADVITEREGLRGVGRVTEFCVGGPIANERTAAHLRSILPGVHFDPYEEAGEDLAFTVGPTEYRRVPAHTEYAVLAKIYPPGRTSPVFLIAGQRARTNLAAARLLATQYRRLLRSYGRAGRFCLILKVFEPDSYGPDYVEVAADASADAFERPAEPADAI